MEHASDPAAYPERWSSTNLVGIAPGLLGSTAFNDHPLPLSIGGARQASRGLFALLDRCQSREQATEIFTHYMDIAFDLLPSGANGLRRRSSYLGLLQGWGLDASSTAGAILKGWVESRFGLVPVFHRGPLLRFPSPAWIGYLEDKAASRHHNNNIQQQLDLLFEFCQWSLQRFGAPGQALGATHLVLWRGCNQIEAQSIERRGPGRRLGGPSLLRLNNIVSFTLSADDADCFGDRVFSVRMPLVKILLYPGLLPLLRGENEVLALGGDYEVRDV